MKNSYKIVPIILAIWLFTLPMSVLADTSGNKQEDIKKFLYAAGLWEQAKQMKTIIMQGFAKQAQALIKDKDVPKEFWTEFYDTIITDDDIKGLVDVMIPIYDKHFSHEEIKELTQVYEKEVFRKWVRLTPQMMQEGAQVGGEWGRKLAQSDTLKKRVDDLLAKYNLK